MLLYFSAAAVGGNETELNQGLRVTFTAHRRHMPTAAARSHSDRRKQLNFLKLSFTAIGLDRLSYEPYCFSEGIIFFSQKKLTNSTFNHVSFHRSEDARRLDL